MNQKAILETIKKVREIKTNEEIKIIQKACKITQKTLNEIPKILFLSLKSVSVIFSENCI